jgi:hypothetical protein
MPGYEEQLAPIAGVIYKPNDKLTFNLVPTRPTITYALNDKVTLFGEGGLSGGEFKITKDDLKGLTLAYNEIHMGGGIQYKINKFIQSSLSVGGMFDRSLKYRDSLGKVTIKDGLYTEFRVEINM